MNTIKELLHGILIQDSYDYQRMLDLCDNFGVDYIPMKDLIMLKWETTLYILLYDNGVFRTAEKIYADTTIPENFSYLKSTLEKMIDDRK